MKPFIPSAILELQEEIKQAAADISRSTTPEAITHFMKEYTALRNQLTMEMEQFAEFKAFELRKQR